MAGHNGTKAQQIRWGRKGGKLGGPRRAAALSARRRREIARVGGFARWAKAETDAPRGED